MKSFVRTASLVALAASLTGCCACRHGNGKSRPALAGTRWSLVQLNGKTVRNDTQRFTLAFRDDDRRIAGVGACNRLAGTYETDGERTLKIGPLAATRTACPDLDRETAFIDALERVVRYDIDGRMLLLLSDEGVAAVLEALP